MTTSTDLQTTSTDSPTLADQMYANAMANAEATGATHAVVGLIGAMAAMNLYAIALQNMEGTLATWAGDLAAYTTDLSDQENDILTADYEYLESLPAPDDTSSNSAQINADRSNDITNAQTKYQVDQVDCNNQIAGPQADVAQLQSDTTAVAQSLANYINTMNLLAQIMSNLSRAVMA